MAPTYPHLKKNKKQNLKKKKIRKKYQGTAYMVYRHSWVPHFAPFRYRIGHSQDFGNPFIFPLATMLNLNLKKKKKFILKFL